MSRPACLPHSGAAQVVVATPAQGDPLQQAQAWHVGAQPITEAGLYTAHRRPKLVMQGLNPDLPPQAAVA